MTEEKAYYEIRHASNEELLEATLYFWEDSMEGDDYGFYQFERGVRLGFALAQKDAWEKVAPAWLRDWRNRKEGME